MKNDEYTVDLSGDPLIFDKFNCHSDSATLLNGATSADLTIDLELINPADPSFVVPSGWPNVWDSMIFDDPFCDVDNYEVSC